MIFIVGADPFGAVQFQTQLRNANQKFVEVFLSAKETEQNLYKLPDLVLLDHSLNLSDLLYLTQTIKAYDSAIQIIWLCDATCAELKRMYKSYGVSHCLNKGEYLLEQIILISIETKEKNSRTESSKKRIEHLRKNILT